MISSPREQIIKILHSSKYEMKNIYVSNMKPTKTHNMSFEQLKEKLQRVVDRLDQGGFLI